MQSRNPRNKSVSSNSKSLSASNKMDMPLLIVVLMLVAIGIIMVLSASAPSALADYNDSYHYVKMQGIAAILGIGIMIFLSRFNYKIYLHFFNINFVYSFNSWHRT